MEQYESVDFSQGYEKFYALVNNLEGIFDKVNKMKKYKLDISYYEERLNDLKKEFNLKDEMLKKSTITFENMRKDFESFALGECNKSLEKLTIDFENDITPIYNIYLLSNSIDHKFKDDNNDDIEEVIKMCKELLNNVNAITSHNNIDIINLYNKAHETLLNGILYESVYNRHEILEYIKNCNNSNSKETIGKLIREKINKLINKKVLTEEDVDKDIINNLNEGLGYDFLSNEFVELLTQKTMTKKYEQIASEREEVIENITYKVEDNASKKETFELKIKEGKVKLTSKMLELALVRSAFCVLAVSPAIIIGVSGHIGKTQSEKITEYATITREINLNDNSLVGEESKVYDDKETNYVATIIVYEPWKKNPTGVGYIRKATAYEYITPDNVSEDYHIGLDDINENVKEKYKYNEAKDTLSENDSMTDSEIHVIETYQNKNDSRKSTRYIIPGYIIGSILGITEEVLLIMSGLYVSLKDKNDEISSDKKSCKERLKTAKETLGKIYKENEQIIQEVEKVNKTYNTNIDVKRLIKK